MSIDTRKIIGNAVRATSLENLEHRQLLAGFSFEGATLEINGTGKSDEIHVYLSDDGATLWATLNGKRSDRYAANNVWAININALDGNNVVWMDPAIKSTTTVHAGKGDDTIITAAGNDGIYSGDGNDVINSGAGNDLIDGGAGNDRINAADGNDFVKSGDGNDIINAGLGVNKVHAYSGSNKVYVEPADLVYSGESRNTITRRFTADPTQVAPQVKRLRLVNADTGAAVGGYENLQNGAWLDLAKLPAGLSVVAELDRAGESVRFTLSDGSINRVENSDLYSLTPAIGANKFSPWKPSVGSVTLTATPYTADDAGGLAGKTYSLTLNFTRSNTGGSTPTPAPAPTPTPTPTYDPAAPTIKMSALASTVIAGQGYHVQATQTIVPGYQVEDAKFAWDFGDPAGKNNTMPGFNAAHVYETPGTYTVKLTVTAPGGKTSVQTTTVNVVASNYRMVYVSANGGSDANDGRYENRAVRTLARALDIAGENAMILLKRGETFTLNTTHTISHNNTVISTYGSGSSPTLFWTGARSGTPAMLLVPTGVQNVAIRNLTFNSVYGTDTEQNGMPHAIQNGGHNVTIEGNTFLNIGYAINNNLLPRGTYIVDNKAPLETGLRAYFSWTEGSDFVIVGNEVANSTREHIVRVGFGGADRINVSNNKFTNLDRVRLGDSRDNDKGTIVLQKGSFGYAANNTLRGPAGIGPLGGSDGLYDKAGRFKHGAFEGNTMFGGTFFFQHGAENVTVRDNTFYKDDGIAINVVAYDATYQRGVVDIVIDHNLGINNGTQGNFVRFDGGAQGVDLTNNIYIAPTLRPGAYASAAVYINENDLSGFRRISGNVWPATGKGGAFSRGGMIFLGKTHVSENYRTASEWNAMSKVGDDYFEDVRIDNAWSRTRSMLRAA